MKYFTSIRILTVSLVLTLFSFLPKDVFSQETKGEGKIIGMMYSQFYHSFDSEVKPNNAFSIRSAILGYKYKYNDRLSFAILYDVTRTTSLEYNQLAGISSYFEGSKYTAFLKMAQIQWNFHPKFSLIFGQLLSNQYLLNQDKLWGMRYIETTAQERFRYGMPADFGTSLSYMPSKNLKLTAAILNGEGPFYLQDDASNLLYVFRAEYKPIEGLQLVAYSDVETIDANDSTCNKEMTHIFVGYKLNRWMAGLEVGRLWNTSFKKGINRDLISSYASYQLNDGFKLIGRFDYGNLSTKDQDYHQYLIGGIEYNELKKFFISINYRLEDYTFGRNVSHLYLNVGLFL